MSDWITDRLPTVEDCPHYGEVWLMLSGCPEVLRGHWSEVKLNNPWQPVICPAPYVKPKRWTVEWDNDLAMWKVASLIGDRRKVAASLWCLSSRKDHAEAAQLICDIYNEVLP
jgi:hypothetical protein